MRNVTEVARVMGKTLLWLAGPKTRRSVASGALLAGLYAVIWFATTTSVQAQAVGSIPLDAVRWTPIGPAPTVSVLVTVSVTVSMTETVPAP